MPVTTASRGERLYIDANVIVYYFYTRQREDFSRKARNLLQKIENNKFEGVVSSLTLMEVMKSLRELLVRYGGIHRVDEVEKIIREALSALFAIRNIRIVEGRPPEFKPMRETQELHFCTVCNEALGILRECPGKPHVDRETGETVHMGLHVPDFFHVVLAKKCQCDKLATFDWDFKEAQNEIVPLILQDYNTIW